MVPVFVGPESERLSKQGSTDDWVNRFCQPCSASDRALIFSILVRGSLLELNCFENGPYYGSAI